MSRPLRKALRRRQTLVEVDSTAGSKQRLATDVSRARWLSLSRHRRRYPSRVRVLVTGGGGFLGSHLVGRLREDGLDPFVARRQRLRPHGQRRRRAAVRRCAAGARPPPCGGGRRHRGESRESRPLLVRQPDDGRACDRAEPPARRRQDRRCSERSAPIRSSRRFPSARTTSGTATRKRPTRRTASRRRRCSSAPRAIGTSTA